MVDVEGEMEKELGQALNKSIGLGSEDVGGRQPRAIPLNAVQTSRQAQNIPYTGVPAGQGQMPDKHKDYAEATSENTDRESRHMIDELNRMVTHYEEAIKRSNAVREKISKRIVDLNVCLSAAKVSLEVLSHRVDSTSGS